MELNTRGRYAVMALAQLAQAGGATAVPLRDIADRQQISLAYLEQIFGELRRADLVASQRGRAGGYRLARAASAISVAQVMSAVGEPLDMTRCGLRDIGGCVDNARCLTHDLWSALGDHILGFLADISLADVVEGRIAVTSDARHHNARRDSDADGHAVRVAQSAEVV